MASVSNANVFNEGCDTFWTEITDNAGCVTDTELNVGFGENEGTGKEGFSFGKTTAHSVDGRGLIVAQMVDGETINGVFPRFVWKAQTFDVLYGDGGGVEE